MAGRLELWRKDVVSLFSDQVRRQRSVRCGDAFIKSHGVIACAPLGRSQRGRDALRSVVIRLGKQRVAGRFQCSDPIAIPVRVEVNTPCRRFDWRGLRMVCKLNHCSVLWEYGLEGRLLVKDLMNHQAWIAFKYDGADLEPEHGGPARLLVPHLYLWKSAKWVKRMTLMGQDKPGFWESLGYHIYGRGRNNATRTSDVTVARFCCGVRRNAYTARPLRELATCANR